MWNERAYHRNIFSIFITTNQLRKFTIINDLIWGRQAEGLSLVQKNEYYLVHPISPPYSVFMSGYKYFMIKLNLSNKIIL